MTNIMSLVIYLVSFICSIGMLYLYSVRIKNKKKNLWINYFLIVGSALILVLLLGCRYYTGTDYKGYIERYAVISNDYVDLFQNTFEIGDYIICKSAYFLSGNQIDAQAAQIMFFLYSIVTIYFIYKALFMYKEKISIPFALSIYLFVFYPFAFNGMRQSLSMAIILCMTKNILDNKKLKSFIYLLLACTFHIPTITFLPFVCLWFLVKNKKNRAIVPIIAYIIIGLLFIPIINIIVQIPLFERYSSYFETMNLQFGLGVLIQNFPEIFILLYYRKKILSDESLSLFFSMFFVGIILKNMGYLESSFSRMAIYFSFSKIIFYPMILFKTVIRDQKILYFIGYVIMITYFILYSYVLGFNGLFPYQFRWFL